MRHAWLRPTIPILLAAVALAACAAGNNTTGTFGGGTNGGAAPGGAGGATATSPSSSSSSGDIGIGGMVPTGSSSSSGGPVTFKAYVHTGKTLYEVDPNAPSAMPVAIGDFDCIGGTNQDTSMTDLAVNQGGEIWGISYNYVYRLAIQGGTVHCAAQIPLNNAQNVRFYGLTFAPPGVLDANKEVLVAGNTAGELWAIDGNGNLTQHGTLGKVPANDGNGHNYPLDSATTGNTVGKAWELSGDIVFLANDGNPVGFATVRDCKSPPSSSACDPTDTLVEIDMTKLKAVGSQVVTLGVRGAVVKRAGCSDPGNAKGYGATYGIAAWNSKVYGFTHSGAIVEIDNADGSACLLVDMPTTYWNGAGVTTDAPIIVPPAK